MFETQWLKIELKNHEYNTTIIVLKLSTHFREKSLIISKFVVALSLIRIFLRHYPYFLTFLTRCSSTGFYLNEKVGLKWVNKFCMERVRIWIFSDEVLDEKCPNFVFNFVIKFAYSDFVFCLCIYSKEGQIMEN